MLLLLLSLACHPPLSQVEDTETIDTGEEPVAVVLLGWSRPAMPVLQASYADYLVWAPGVDLRAQAVLSGAQAPELLTDLSLSYSIPGNTTSVGETDLEQHASELLGLELEPDQGLGGAGLSGALVPAESDRYAISGLLHGPEDDQGEVRPYQVFQVEGEDGLTQPGLGAWLSTCDDCHGSGLAVLQAHDTAQGTGLADSRPVLCADCHASPALGREGIDGVSSLVEALHTAHPGTACTDCHGDLSRGLHTFIEELGCEDCHVGPDLPRCTDCHAKEGFSYQQEGLSYDASWGHGGLACAACHGPMHAISPSREDTDDAQNEAIQGYHGQLSNCRVCHVDHPGVSMPH